MSGWILVWAMIAWFVCGTYGALANMERVPRVWGKESWGDWIQHMTTFFLGPIGVALVMSTGGRAKFWQ